MYNCITHFVQPVQWSIEDRVRFALPQHTKSKDSVECNLRFFRWGRWSCFKEGTQTLYLAGIIVLGASDDAFVVQKSAYSSSWFIGREQKLAASQDSSPHGPGLKVLPGCFVHCGHCSKLLSGVRSRLGLTPGWCSFVGRWWMSFAIAWRSGLYNTYFRPTNNILDSRQSRCIVKDSS